jgi:hypothetical protein
MGVTINPNTPIRGVTINPSRRCCEKPTGHRSPRPMLLLLLLLRTMPLSLPPPLPWLLPLLLSPRASNSTGGVIVVGVLITPRMGILGVIIPPRGGVIVVGMQVVTAAAEERMLITTLTLTLTFLQVQLQLQLQRAWVSFPHPPQLLPRVRRLPREEEAAAAAPVVAAPVAIVTLAVRSVRRKKGSADTDSRVFFA